MNLLARVVPPVKAMSGLEVDFAQAIRTNHGPTLMIEVAQDNLHALVFLSQQILDRDLDVIEGNIGGSGSRRVRSLDGLGFHALASRYQKDTEVFASANAGDKVVTKGSVGNPFFGSVDDLDTSDHGQAKHWAGLELA